MSSKSATPENQATLNKSAGLPRSTLNALKACGDKPSAPLEVVQAHALAVHRQAPAATRYGLGKLWGAKLVVNRGTEPTWEGWIALGESDGEKEAA